MCWQTVTKRCHFRRRSEISNRNRKPRISRLEIFCVASMASSAGSALSPDVPTFILKDPVKDAENLSNTDASDTNATAAARSSETSFESSVQSHAQSDEDDSDNDAAYGSEQLNSEETRKLHNEAMSAKDEGNSAFRDECYDKAIGIYSNALSKCSRSVHAKDCAILYSNRAAAKLKLKMFTPAAQDCTKSINLDKGYTRAYFRRGTAFEALEKYEEAISDYQEVLKQDATVKEAAEALRRLPKLIEARNERLKTEMFDKLKQLGNSVLRPFGMSVNNFKLEQDAKSGGYSVKYDQNAKK